MASLHEREIPLDELMPVIREELARGGQVRFAPRGVSMLPMLHQGRDTVTLSPLPEKLKKYDLPLYQRENGQYVIHRIVKVGDTYTCMGDNQFVPEPGLKKEQMIALVTSFSRKGKEYAVDAWQYRLYCRFWYHTRLIRRCWRKVRSLCGRIAA